MGHASQLPPIGSWLAHGPVSRKERVLTLGPEGVSPQPAFLCLVSPNTPLTQEQQLPW